MKNSKSTPCYEKKKIILALHEQCTKTLFTSGNDRQRAPRCYGSGHTDQTNLQTKLQTTQGRADNQQYFLHVTYCNLISNDISN